MNCSNLILIKYCRNWTWWSLWFPSSSGCSHEISIKTHKSRRLLAVPRFNLQGLVEQIICKLLFWDLPHGIEIFKEFLNETSSKNISKISRQRKLEWNPHYSVIQNVIFHHFWLLLCVVLCCLPPIPPPSFDNCYSCKISAVLGDYLAFSPLSNPQRDFSWLLTRISGSTLKQ